MENILNAIEQMERRIQNSQRDGNAKCKITMDDIFGDTIDNDKKKSSNKQSKANAQDAKIQAYRKQVEYGPKKFIKP